VAQRQLHRLQDGRLDRLQAAHVLPAHVRHLRAARAAPARRGAPAAAPSPHRSVSSHSAVRFGSECAQLRTAHAPDRQGQKTGHLLAQP